MRHDQQFIALKKKVKILKYKKPYNILLYIAQKNVGITVNSTTFGIFLLFFNTTGYNVTYLYLNLTIKRQVENIVVVQ